MGRNAVGPRTPNRVELRPVSGCPQFSDVEDPERHSAGIGDLFHVFPVRGHNSIPPPSGSFDHRNIHDVDKATLANQRSNRSSLTFVHGVDSTPLEQARHLMLRPTSPRLGENPDWDGRSKPAPEGGQV